MSLSLSESCVKYERYVRRHKDIPTFEQFNAQHYTCLPSNDKAYSSFKRAVSMAHRAEGIPIQRRLPSLLRYLETTETSLAAPEPSVQVRPATNAFQSQVPAYEKSIKMNIRSPVHSEEVAVESSQVSESEISESEVTERARWTVESFKELLSVSSDPCLVEKSGSMVHFVPTDSRDALDLKALSCKLTKSSWSALRAGTDIKMRDGNTVSLASMALNEQDMKTFVKQFKKKTKGPYFIRFSSI